MTGEDARLESSFIDLSQDGKDDEPVIVKNMHIVISRRAEGQYVQYSL